MCVCVCVCCSVQRFSITNFTLFSVFQSSTELTAQMLPDVVKLLTLPDESTVLEASKLLMELSKKEASCRAIIANGQVLNMIIQAMAGTGNPEIQKNLSGVLHHCSNDQ